MKQLSRRCKYALRALYRLNRAYETGQMSVLEIAEQEKIPRKFLEAILVQLRNAGIVASQMGKKGGYRLAKAPGHITIGSIVRIIDGPLAPTPCASERSFRVCEECTDHAYCETRILMRRVRDAIAGVLDQTTLEDACRKGGVESALTYDI